MKLKKKLKLGLVWQYDPAAPIPPEIPARASTGLGGPIATVHIPSEDVLLRLQAYDTLAQVDGLYIVLNGPAAYALLEDD